MNSSLLGAVGATLKSVGETNILSEIRSNFEETFELRYCIRDAMLKVYADTLVSSSTKAEKSEVQVALEQWKEQMKQNGHPIEADMGGMQHIKSQVLYDDVSTPPPAACFSVQEDQELPDSASSVALTAAAALRGVELKAKDMNLHSDDQASVYDKVFFA